jgi:hypothetical protein
MSKKSLLRKEMEGKRIDLKKRLDAVEIELVQIDEVKHFKSEKVQVFKSKKRLLIREINNLTLGIKNITEIENDDPSVISEMDETYKKLESGEITIDDIKCMIKHNDEDKDDEEWSEGETQVMDAEDEKEDKEPQKGLKDASDDDINDAIDDLLDNL